MRRMVPLACSAVNVRSSGTCRSAIDARRAGDDHRGMLAYKVVETSSVTEENLESIINEHVKKGWAFDGMQFAMRDSSKRPAMAFLLFTRQEPDPPADS